MPVYKDEKTNTWYSKFRYKDWTGKTRDKMKRGFTTKRDAQKWENNFKVRLAGNLDMSFGEFVKIYKEERFPRLKESTRVMKENVIATHILPYFENRRINEISSTDIIKWQNELLTAINPNTGRTYAKSYLKTIHNQINAIFNYACRYYKLRENPASIAGGIGSEDEIAMEFWTLDEYLKFSEEMMTEPIAYYAFQILYWLGCREGDDDDKIRLNQRKPSKYKGLRRFGPEKNLQRINKFMKERPIFYKNLIQMKENIRFYLRCFYCITKVMILQFNSENRTELARNG